MHSVIMRKRGYVLLGSIVETYTRHVDTTCTVATLLIVWNASRNIAIRPGTFYNLFIEPGIAMQVKYNGHFVQRSHQSSK